MGPGDAQRRHPRPGGVQFGDGQVRRQPRPQRAVQLLGTPTSYYASVHFHATAEIVEDAAGKAEILNR
ncbi:hypothetical protein ACWC5I_32220, partial [Kitasatospora sp. NPDC001574]